MAGLRGNQANLLVAKQSAKGAAGVPTLTASNCYKMPFSGGNMTPTRATDNLAETDSSRDRGTSYVASTAVEGSPEFYVRDASIGFWIAAAFGIGSDNVTGTTNFTHSITPTNTLPYISAWRNIADTLFEHYRDCKVGSLSISAEAGAPLTCTAGLMGLLATRLTAAPDAALNAGAGQAMESGPVYNYNVGTVTLAGGQTALVRSFELTVENNLTSQQTDDVTPYDIAEGTREVSLGFDLIFETLTEYNQFYYGGAAGTTVSSAIYTTSATFDFAIPGLTNNGFAFTLPRIAYEEFPVEPDAGGDPIVSSVRAVGQRGATPIITATVKNQVASY